MMSLKDAAAGRDNLLAETAMRLSLDDANQAESLTEGDNETGVENPLFDTDEAFACFTDLATHVLNVPVSLVSLIDHDKSRQAFKAQTGLPEPWASQMETPLTHSFCKHVAHNDHMLCIEDATKADLVKDNLAIPKLGVMAYLGTPIRNMTGQAIGAFCVISGDPRKWTNTDKETISHIAQCVSELIIAKEELT